MSLLLKILILSLILCSILQNSPFKSRLFVTGSLQSNDIKSNRIDNMAHKPLINNSGLMSASKSGKKQSNQKSALLRVPDDSLITKQMIGAALVVISGIFATISVIIAHVLLSRIVVVSAEVKELMTLLNAFCIDDYTEGRSQGNSPFPKRSLKKKHTVFVPETIHEEATTV